MFEYAARLIRVVDGDTLRLDIDLGLHTWLHDQRMRVARVNAPELGTPEGEAAKAALEEKLGADPALVVRTIKDRADPYGRYLVDVVSPVFGAQTLSEWLLAQGYAVRWP